MQTLNDRRYPRAWFRQKAILNVALAILFTVCAILVGFGLPTAADERPVDPFGNHTTELNKDAPLAGIWASARDKMQLEKAYFHECQLPKRTNLPISTHARSKARPDPKASGQGAAGTSQLVRQSHD
jgi:hypothetical protein